MIINQYKIPSPHPKIQLFWITYLSDGLLVKGYLAIPQWGEAKPGLLYLRGGIKNVGMVRIQRVIQWAAEGMVVFAPFYRGNRGGEGYEDFCGEDRYDAYAAFDVLMSHPEVLPSSVHILGFSRGGVMGLLTASNRPAATVTSWNGVSDMFLTYEERVDLRRMMKRVIGGTPSKYPERYKWRTPLYEIDKMKAKCLIIHGAQDQHVSIEHAYRLEEACQLHKKHVDTWYFEQFTHHFPAEEQRRILSKAAQWMKEN